MVTVHYRRWCPPQSPLRIEFPAALLREVRLESARTAETVETRWRPWWRRAPQQTSGVLFGTRRHCDVRVLVARGGLCGSPDPKLAGLEPLGIFISRPRGEVFLTDDDLERFEQQHGILALVIAGGRAGFFVRKPDGSMQTIRSHEEFRVADVAAELASGEAPSPQEPSPPPLRFWKWAAAGVLLLALLAAGFAYVLPLLPRLPLALTLHEEAGQLVIAWNPSTLTKSSRLEIREGSDKIVTTLGANASSATYPLKGLDVEVRLTTDTRTGVARWEAGRFDGRNSGERNSAASALRGRIDALAQDAQRLRESLADGKARVERLVNESRGIRPER